MRLVFTLLWLLHWLPVSVISLLARLVGHVAYHVAGERRKVGLINLRLCFPEWSEKQRIATLKRHFGYMIELALLYGICWWAPAKRIQKLVKLKNLHYLTDLTARGEDVIIFYPHFASFEMCVYRLNQDVPLVSVYSHQKNAAMDAQIYRGRQRYNNVKIVSRQESLRSIIKAMKAEHTPFLYLPDQDFGPRDSVFVKFFHTDAATIPGMARIAQLARARVVPAIPRRTQNGFELEFYPAWERYPSDDILADTRRMNAFLEERIREMPAQYFWLHKRFKTRPEGEKRFY